MKYKWCVLDGPVKDLFITKEVLDESYVDGEFIFDTLSEAKEHCLRIIDDEIFELKSRRAEIKKISEDL